MTDPVIIKHNTTDLPTVHVVSDSVGSTAQAVAQAAASQFGTNNPCVEVFAKATSIDEIIDYLEGHLAFHERETGSNVIVVFYTLVNRPMRDAFRAYLAEHPEIHAVDVLSPAIDAIAQVSGKEPSDVPGNLHVTDQRYFDRIEAMEFTIAHDDGRNPHGLTKADIVLLGVSRCSKTPTSIYLSQLGYKVANIPLDLSTEPPEQIYEVDPRRIFGLTTTPEVLINIRRRRLGEAISVASDYADPELVYQDLEKARALMRSLGCIVINTDKRAIEETAQEILRYYMRAFA